MQSSHGNVKSHSQQLSLKCPWLATYFKFEPQEQKDTSFKEKEVINVIVIMICNHFLLTEFPTHCHKDAWISKTVLAEM